MGLECGSVWCVRHDGGLEGWELNRGHCRSCDPAMSRIDIDVTYFRNGEVSRRVNGWIEYLDGKTEECSPLLI